MKNNNVKQAILELTSMARFYRERGRHEKAAELMDLIDRMERTHLDENNVVSMSRHQEEQEHKVGHELNQRSAKA